jgi:ABC-type dipeptide/oligopeptide/nickel transport system ATPase component
MLDKELIKREIDKLPEDVLGEVLDFIQFLETKKERNLLARYSQELSTGSFQRIWDNEEDAAYDTVQ